MAIGAGIGPNDDPVSVVLLMDTTLSEAKPDGKVLTEIFRGVSTFGHFVKEYRGRPSSAYVFPNGEGPDLEKTKNILRGASDRLKTREFQLCTFRGNDVPLELDEPTY